MVAATVILGIGAVATAAIVSGTATSGASARSTFTQLTLNKPSVSVGTVMIASIAVNGGSSVNITPPTGWTQIVRTDNDVDIALISYWKVAGTSEPATYIWTVDQQTRAVGGITPYTGVSTVAPIDSYSGNYGFSKVATTSSITTGVSNEEVIAVFATDVNKILSTPVGMTQKYNLSHAALGPSLADFDVTQSSPGSVGNKASSIGGNKARNWVAQAISLKLTSPVPAPVAYWKLDGNSNDAAGSNNGTDTNVTYSIGNGKINQGAGFDGSTSRIDIGHMISGAVDVSTGAWIKTSQSSGILYIIAQRHDPNPMPSQWSMYLANGKVEVHTEGNVLDGSTMVADGNWHYVGFAQSGTNYKIYVDGVEDGSLTGGVPTNYAGMLAGTIGYSELDLHYLGQGYYFNGSIDEAGVWNTTLSAADFAALYNSGIGKQYPF